MRGRVTTLPHVLRRWHVQEEMSFWHKDSMRPFPSPPVRAAIKQHFGIPPHFKLIWNLPWGISSEFEFRWKAYLFGDVSFYPWQKDSSCKESHEFQSTRTTSLLDNFECPFNQSKPIQTSRVVPKEMEGRYGCQMGLKPKAGLLPFSTRHGACPYFLARQKSILVRTLGYGTLWGYVVPSNGCDIQIQIQISPWLNLIWSKSKIRIEFEFNLRS